MSLPWQWSAVIGVLATAFCLAGPGLFPGKPYFPGLQYCWWLPVLFFGGTAVGSAIHAKRRRVTLRHVHSRRDLEALPWQEFEKLTGTYYEQRGFIVVHTGRSGPDGGIDLVLRKDGERVLVQCKKYANKKVGVQAVREFYGVVVAEGAHRGVFIATAGFTRDAMEFGLRHAALELVPGDRFAEMIAWRRNDEPTLGDSRRQTRADSGNRSRVEPERSGDSRGQIAEGKQAKPTPHQMQNEKCRMQNGGAKSMVPVSDIVDASPPIPCCPRCKAPMVSRWSRSGRNPGRLFWGCPRFAITGCKGTRTMRERQVCGAEVS